MAAVESRAPATVGLGDATGDLGVYVHWPFCLSKCPYCDFNSHVTEAVDHRAWVRAYKREIDHLGGLTRGRRVTTVFFGGGTPSLMAPDTVAEVLGAVAQTWPLADALEVTLEANPTSVEAERFRAFRAAGVNRVSIGVQALDDDALAFLGRGHSVVEALAALALAAATFPRFSFDLIYARPGQSAAGWARELERALGFGAAHLSLYQLTIEPGTAFHAAWRQGRLALPDDDTQAALYELTQAVLEAAGLPAYEISNHARPGQECRHNLLYWRGGDYVGVGPGAHGRIEIDGVRHATEAHRRPGRWLEAVEAAGHGIAQECVLSPETSARDLLMMGLRLSQGVSLAGFGSTQVAPLESVIDGKRLGELIEQGYLQRADGRLRTSPRGRLLLNAILGQLMT